MNQTSFVAVSTRHTGSTTLSGHAMRLAASKLVIARDASVVRDSKQEAHARANVLVLVNEVATTLAAIPEASGAVLSLLDVEQAVERGGFLTDFASTINAIAKEVEAAATSYERRAWANNLA